MTPRKFKSQLEVHVDIQRKRYGSTSNMPAVKTAATSYIDQIPGW